MATRATVRGYSPTTSHRRGSESEQASLDDAHDPIHQTRFPRLILGLVALVPLVSLVMALVAEGATRAALGYFHVLWTALLVLIFGTWMVKNPTLTLDRKLAWGFLFVLIAPLSLPLYWRRHVWRAPTSTVTHD